MLVPCYNEERSIGQVIHDFKVHLPTARIYVFNNNSTDRTLQIAREAGAIARDESIQGKGNVVRQMFADVEADVYVLVDGDNTYDAACAGAAVKQLVSRSLDVVNIARAPSCGTVYRPGHQFGNALISGVVAAIFGDRFADTLSGYKIFSRRFVKSFPAFARGFEIETELTIHALELRMPVAEMHGSYRERPAGSASKLKTVRDGLRILMAILALIREEKPLQFFSLFAFLFATVSLGLAWPLVTHYMATGLVPRLPTAVLCSGDGRNILNSWPRLAAVDKAKIISTLEKSPPEASTDCLPHIAALGRLRTDRQAYAVNPAETYHAHRLAHRAAERVRRSRARA